MPVAPTSSQPSHPDVRLVRISDTKAEPGVLVGWGLLGCISDNGAFKFVNGEGSCEGTIRAFGRGIGERLFRREEYGHVQPRQPTWIGVGWRRVSARFSALVKVCGQSNTLPWHAGCRAGASSSLPPLSWPSLTSDGVDEAVAGLLAFGVWTSTRPDLFA
ncbi:hypothetical protein LX32DRAFT_188545 [Colletotrichum zoysiae]|uniref:Uncharacterized protein n=1 Tax=Colletotrichum zoysiae TaxID=1216348 RepID=A0AAD9H715_9PEZI|nr:hypothetical protein LX32DRAFT_188545 [Colletotrichum zoysiae]